MSLLAAAGIGAAATLAGSYMGSQSADAYNQSQIDMAKNSISYRVADAKKAGIHPLYALGAPTMSTSHQTDPMGQGVASAGQQVSRAVEGQKDSNFDEQYQKNTLAGQRADLISKKMNNEILAAELRRVNQPPANQGLSMADMPNHVQEAVKYLQHKHATGSYYAKNPNIIAAEKILSGVMDPSEVSENVFGDTGGEVHGLSNMADTGHKYFN